MALRSTFLYNPTSKSLSFEFKLFLHCHIASSFGLPHVPLLKSYYLLKAPNTQIEDQQTNVREPFIHSTCAMMTFFTLEEYMYIKLF